MKKKGKIDINRAAPEDIQIIAGVDYSVARSIVDYRAFKLFNADEDLEKIPGIDKATLRNLKESVWFSNGRAPAGSRTTRKRASPRGKRNRAANDQVDINHAGPGELMSLPHIGERIAEAIIEYRTSHGEFKSLDDVQKIPGFGPRTMENIKDRIHF